MAEYALFSLDTTVQLLVVDRIDPQSNKFVTGVEDNVSSDSKCNVSPV